MAQDGPITIENRGLNRALDNLAKLNSGITSEEPMKKAVEVITRAAKANAPVDTRALRDSITPGVTSRNNEVVGVVGSELVHAAVMEEGSEKKWWPPKDAIEEWAERRGISAFLVARAISRRGLKGRKFLKRALNDNANRVVQEFKAYYNRLTREAN